MRQEEYNDLVIKLDKNMAIMMKSIANNADVSKSTLSKMDEFIVEMKKQAVLYEKVASIKDDVDSMQKSGCPNAVDLRTMIKVVNNRLKNLEESSKWMHRTFIGSGIVFILGLVSSVILYLIKG